jgi:hypothetical protein
MIKSLMFLTENQRVRCKFRQYLLNKINTLHAKCKSPIADPTPREQNA